MVLQGTGSRFRRARDGGGGDDDGDARPRTQGLQTPREERLQRESFSCHEFNTVLSAWEVQFGTVNQEKHVMGSGPKTDRVDDTGLG
jgi:hypothetical protein